MSSVQVRLPMTQSKRPMKTPVFTALVLLGLLSFHGNAYGNRPARLSVKVVNEREEPVVGVRVTITHKDQSSYLKRKTTDGKGRFHLQVVAPYLLDDCFSLLFEVAGYQPQRVFVRLAPTLSVRSVYRLRSERRMEPRKQGVAVLPKEDVSVGDSKKAAIYFYSQGLEALKHSDLESARQKLQKAIRLNHFLVPAYVGLAEVEVQAGRPNDAIEAVMTALTIEPDSIEAKRMAFRAYSESGDWESAEEFVDYW